MRNLASLEEKINDLDAEVRSELAVEDATWDEAAAIQEIDSVDEFIKVTQNPKDTVAEIDKILGVEN